MSKTRFIWWGYVKAMIRRYPELKAEYDTLMEQAITPYYGGIRGANIPGRPVEKAISKTLGKNDQRELDAVLTAIQETKRRRGGQERLMLIDLVFWRRSKTLQGAAIELHVSGRTARRWHEDFIKAVAKHFGLLDESCAN